MIAIKSKRWVFTTAKTDFAVLTPGAAEYVAIHKVSVTNAGSTVPDVSAEVGVAASALPTIVNDSATGGDGIAFSHGGIKPGGGSEVNGGETPLVVGGIGEPVLITCSAATGGAIRVIVGHRLVDTTPAP